MINQELIDFSNYLADLSSNIAQKYFRKDIGEQHKEDSSPVTLADQEIEDVIRREIKKKYPEHGIIGEEYDNINLEADFKWVIDPIDGTSSFIMGKPLFGTLVCLTYKDKPVLGILNQPINKERWVGAKGRGTSFNSKETNVRKCQTISNSVFCTTSPAYFEGKELDFFNKIASKTKYQKAKGVFYGGDCYLYGLLALGSVDIIIETGLSNYDYCALVPIIEEAGGIITDWNGNSVDINSNGKIIACGDQKVHQEILEIVKEYGF